MVVDGMHESRVATAEEYMVDTLQNHRGCCCCCSHDAQLGFHKRSSPKLWAKEQSYTLRITFITNECMCDVVVGAPLLGSPGDAPVLVVTLEDIYNVDGEELVSIDKQSTQKRSLQTQLSIPCQTSFENFPGDMTKVVV